MQVHNTLASLQDIEVPSYAKNIRVSSPNKRIIFILESQISHGRCKSNGADKES
jgi:hypothetical protein